MLAWGILGTGNPGNLRSRRALRGSARSADLRRRRAWHEWRRDRVVRTLAEESSAVTSGATGQALDFVLFHELQAQRLLIARRFVTHLKHRFARSHVLLRMAMAVKAPFHLQRGLLPGERHLVHAAVAG